MSASAQIERFLRANPYGHLYVTVGYASTAGLAWLNTRTQGRPVTLVIGNAKNTYFAKSTSTDRSSALEFLARTDVQVKNWYRTEKGGDPSEAHAKAWMVQNDSSNLARISVMLGSANLTKQGLYHNVEMMAFVTGAEATRLWTEMHDLISEAWDCKERIVRYLENSDGPAQQRRQPIEPARAPTAPVYQPDALARQRQQFKEIKEPLTTPDYRARRRRHRKRQASRRNRAGCARSVVLICTGLLLITGLMIALSALLESLLN